MPYDLNYMDANRVTPNGGFVQVTISGGVGRGSTTSVPCRKTYIAAGLGDTVYVNVGSTVGTTGFLLPQEPDYLVLEVSDLSAIYFKGTDGGKVNILYLS